MDPFDRMTYSPISPYRLGETAPTVPVPPPPDEGGPSVEQCQHQGVMMGVMLLTFLETLETHGGYHLTHEEALTLAAQVWRPT